MGNRTSIRLRQLIETIIIVIYVNSQIAKKKKI